MNRETLHGNFLCQKAEQMRTQRSDQGIENEEIEPTVEASAVDQGEDQRIIGIRYRNEILHRLVELAAKGLTKKMTIHGEENLDYVSELMQADQRIILAVSHEGMFDAAAVDMVLDKKHRKDISEKVVNVYGISSESDKVVKRLAKAFSVIPVVSPFTQNIDKKYKKDLQEAAGEDIPQTLKEGGVLVVFPESTRSRDGQLNKGVPSVEPIFEMVENTWVVPVSLDGTRDIWPRDDRLHRGSFVASIGQPIAMEDLKSKYAHLKAKPYRQAVVDEIMGAIVRMHPEEKHGYYKKESMGSDETNS